MIGPLDARIRKEIAMLFQLSIVPLGSEESLSEHVAEALRIIDDSELPYLLTPGATCIEGEWDDVMDVIRKCHENARDSSSYVITNIRVSDEAGADNKLVEDVSSVEAKVGKPLRRVPS
jgi:uncharacterized protein (TIGR00106 family)